jgi:hypothetical protein
VGRRLLIALAGFAAVLLGAFALGSRDRCGEWPTRPPALTGVGVSEGPLLAGAAKVELRFPRPVTVAGYGPWRSTATEAAAPLFARALVFDVGGQRLGLVVLDTLLVAPQLRDRVAEGHQHPVWLVATHTHSGPGGFDTRPAAQLAGVGAFDAVVESTLVDTARKALAEATARLGPAHLETRRLAANPLAVARSGAAVDERVSLVSLSTAAGDPLAELWIASMHPTLVAQRTTQLDPDWPGALAARREAGGVPISLVVQGAGGNASVKRGTASTPEAVAAELANLASATREDSAGADTEAMRFAFSEVRVSLPRPDAARLVPAVARAFTENLLCDGAEDVATLRGLKLGALRLLFVPLEPSYAAGLVLEEQAGAERLVSLAGGYAGYVETVEAARAATGESRRQYFPPELLQRLAEGAQLAGAALGP